MTPKHTHAILLEGYHCNPFVRSTVEIILNWQFKLNYLHPGYYTVALTNQWNKATLNLTSWHGWHYFLHHFGASIFFLLSTFEARSTVLREMLAALRGTKSQTRRRPMHPHEKTTTCISQGQGHLPDLGKTVWRREAAWMLFHHNSSVNKSDSISDEQPKKLFRLGVPLW